MNGRLVTSDVSASIPTKPLTPTAPCWSQIRPAARGKLAARARSMPSARRPLPRAKSSRRKVNWMFWASIRAQAAVSAAGDIWPLKLKAKITNTAPGTESRKAAIRMLAP